MNLNNQPPFFGPTQPIYPHLLQLLRVTGDTIPGPLNGPLVVYIAYTEQLRSDVLGPLLPRDREPCLADDINVVGLYPGYYLGRLAGQYTGLPVYEVIMYPVGGNPNDGGGGYGILPGVTPAQVNMLSASLTPGQYSNLNNLTACQLQVLLQLPVTNIKSYTTDLNPTQLQKIVGDLTYTQLSQIATQISPPQSIVVSNAFPQTYQLLNQSLTSQQAISVLINLTSQQFSTLVNLNSVQLQTIAQLPTPQLQNLTNLTTKQVTTLVDQLTLAQLQSILTTLTQQQLQQFTNNYTTNQIGQLLQSSVTIQQLANIVTLPPSQNASLFGLTTPQLQTIVQLTPSQMQTLTTTLTVSQLMNLLDTLTFTQLQSIVTNVPPPQIIVATSAFPQLYTLLNQVLTQTQVSTLLTNLTSQQIQTLINLTGNQLQTVAQLPIGQVGTLTNLNQNQVVAIVGQLIPSQLTSIVLTFNITQLQQISNTFTSNQIQQIMQSVSISTFTTLLSTLTPPQFQNLLTYPPATINSLATTLTPTQLQTFLNNPQPLPDPVLGSQTYFPVIPVTTGKPSSIPTAIPSGYAPIVATSAGSWAYIGGTWVSLGTAGGGGGPATDFEGGTSNDPAVAPAGTLCAATTTVSGIPTFVGTCMGQTIYNSVDNVDYSWNGIDWVVKNKAPLSRVSLGSQTTVSGGTLTISGVTLNSGDLLVVVFGGSQANADPSGGITWNGISLSNPGGNFDWINVGRFSFWSLAGSSGTGNIVATVSAPWGAIVAFKIVGSTGNFGASASNNGSTGQPTFTFNNGTPDPMVATVFTMLEGDSSSVVVGGFQSPFINGNQTVNFSDGSGNNFAIIVGWAPSLPVTGTSVSYMMTGCTFSLYGAWISTWY